MAALEQQASEFKDALARTERLTKGAFPIDGRKYAIHADNFHWTNVGDAMFADVAAQKMAKQKESSFSAILRADVHLTDASGKLIETRKNHPVVEFPHLTKAGGYIVNGQERQVIKQMRLRPGMYGDYGPDGDPRVLINTSAAGAYKVHLKSATGNCYLSLGLTNIPIYSALRAMGATDADVQAVLGADLFSINRKVAKVQKDTAKFYQKLRPFNKMPAELHEARTEIALFMESKPLDAAVTQATMGTASDKIDKGAVISAVRKAILLSKKETETDDTESMAYKTIMGLEDFIEERLVKNMRLMQGRVKGVLNKSIKSGKIPTILESLPPATFSSTIQSFFSTSDMSRFADQNNPVDMLSQNTLITSMGEGGIGSTHAVKDDVRAFHPTHMGVLDPVAQPEGASIGLSSQLTDSVRKKGNKLHFPVFNARTGKRGMLEVGAAAKLTVAFPDQYLSLPKEGENFPGKPKAKGAKVRARVKDSVAEVKPSTVDFIFADASSFFSSTTLLIPFVQNNHANRVLMGDKHISQTVALKDPDVQLVRHEVRGTEYCEEVGKRLLAHAPISGQVIRVSKDYIKIRPKNGKPVTVSIYNHYPLNSKTFLTETAVVKTGDQVKKGQRLTDNNFTKGGKLAIGKNLRVGYFADEGDTFEDAIVVSSDAAKKLTSTHKAEFRIEKSKSITIGSQAFVGTFPQEIEHVRPTSDYDSDGVIVKGAKLKHGQIVIPAIRKAAFHPELDLSRLKKSIGVRWTNVSEVWDNDYPGEVVDVIKTGKMIKVLVKYHAPLQVADKLSLYHGAKGVISTIRPTNEMPVDEAGNPLEIIINTAAVPGRVNPGQMLDAAAGKVAEKTGKPFVVKNFDGADGSSLADVKAALKKHGLKDAETITDPVTGRKTTNVLVGRAHVIKLKHMVSGKISGRNTIGDSYTTSEQPGKGGKASAQRIGALDTFSLLSGDATAFLHDVFGVKGQRNDDYWMALQAGKQPPPPKTPLVAEKFVAMLLAAGMDIKQDGDTLQAVPMVDSEVLKMSHGTITNPSALKSNTLAPERGGLFDKSITGGVEGNRWSMIKLESPVVNPLLTQAVVSVGGFATGVEFKKLMEGKFSVSETGVLQTNAKGPLTGADGVKRILSKVDVDKEIKRSQAEAKVKRGAAREKAFRKLRYLKNLKEMDMRPEEAYIQHVIPVLPPKFRQVTAMDDGTLSVADSNHGYREVLLVNEQIKKLRDAGFDETMVQPLKTELTKAVSGLAGITDPVTRSKNFQGMVGQIKGRTSSKFGFFQRQVASRTQDLSARSVIVPNSKLHMDEVGVPREIARRLYRPFIIRRMTTMGYDPKTAKELLDAQDPIADRAMQLELEHRPVYLNRAPSLHKFSMVALKPRLIDGKAIETNSLIVGGLGADYDGDQVGLHIPVSEAARKEALEKMLPSHSMFMPSNDAPIHVPSKEAVHGIWLMTRPKGGEAKATTKSAALKAYREKKLKVNSPIKVGGAVRCPGQFLLAEVVPASGEYDGGVVTKNTLMAIIARIGKAESSAVASDIITRIKDLGNHYVGAVGWAVSLKDLEINTKKRDKIIGKIELRTAKVGFEQAALEAQRELQLLVSAAVDTNAFAEASVGSGALGKAGQLTQMIAAPVAFTDHRNRVVPIVVGKSFAEGHDLAAYMATIPGARKGLIDKGLSVADTGYESRMIVNSNIETRITMQDCGTRLGISLKLDDQECLGRFILAGPHKGEHVTDALRRTLQKTTKKIEVRSPLNCQATSGICSKCFGTKAGGGLHRTGYHIGALAGQTIGERATQVTLRNFHSGGAVGSSSIGFGRIRELLEMPSNIKGKATLAEVDGTISRIDIAPAGGQYIYVDMTKHFIPAGQKKSGIRVGRTVKAGDPLSLGPITPQEMLQHTGNIHKVRKYLVDELHGVYGGSIKKRIFETAVKPLTDKAKITNPGDGAVQYGVAIGDVVATAAIENYNTELKKSHRRLIQFEPMVFGIKKAPLHSDDFIGRLSHEQLKKTLQEAPAYGLKSRMKGGHPITQLALTNLHSIRQVKGI